MKCIGLTNDPDKARTQHGSPSDWWEHEFMSETAASAWLEHALTKPGHTADKGDRAGRHGFAYEMKEKKKKK
ncbi:MAG: hypothetical protein JW759_03615 [Candidatus Coatesbacteria bacterium]|nr:hypothetical protein [Candidatus Coatesbacteria bacterium]